MPYLTTPRYPVETRQAQVPATRAERRRRVLLEAQRGTAGILLEARLRALRGLPR